MVKVILNLLLTMILGALKSTALKVIAELNAETLTNAQKREAAFDKIKNITIADGKNLRDSLINLVIEVAVNYLKNK